MNESLIYSQSHPDEIRALLPAAIRDIRLAIWSPVLDRKKLLQLAQLAKKYGDHQRLPDFTKLVPGTISSGVILKGDVGATTISLKLDKSVVKTLDGRRGHGRRLRPVVQAELPPQRAWGRQEDRRQEGREDHLDGHLQAGHVPLLLRLEPEAQGILQGRVVTVIETCGGAALRGPSLAY